MKKLIIILNAFLILMVCGTCSLNASENDSVNTNIDKDNIVNDVEAAKTYTKVANLNQKDYESIVEYIVEIQEQAGQYITYSDNLVPQIPETLYLDIPGHTVKIFQNGNDIALSFDNINTYLIEHEVVDTPSTPVITPYSSPWVWYSHVTITNKDWVKPVKILNTATGVIVFAAPPVMKTPIRVVHTVGKTVTKLSSRQVIYYGSQDRYKAKSSSREQKYVTKWYSNVACDRYGKDAYMGRIKGEHGEDITTTTYMGCSTC